MAFTTIPAEGDAIGKACLVVESISQSGAFISVGLRLWAKRFKRQKIQLDDYLIIISLVCSVGVTICHFLSVIQGGLGLPSEEVSPESVSLSLKLIPPPEALWSVGNTLVKLCFLVFFRSVFSPEKYRRRFMAVGVFCVSVGIASLVQTMAICVPFNYQWDKSITNGHCGQEYLGILLVAVFNMITDLFVFALPVPIIWSLRVPSRRRRGLIMIFCLGVFVVCLTVLRVALTGALIDDQENSTYWIGIAVIFLQLEITLGIVAACIPIWIPLINRRTRKKFTDASAKPGMHSGHGTRLTESYIRLTDLSAQKQDPGQTLTETRVEGGITSGSRSSNVQPSGHETGITITTDVEIRRDITDA